MRNCLKSKRKFWKAPLLISFYLGRLYSGNGNKHKEFKAFWTIFGQESDNHGYFSRLKRETMAAAERHMYDFYIIFHILYVINYIVTK